MGVQRGAGSKAQPWALRSASDPGGEQVGADAIRGQAAVPGTHVSCFTFDQEGSCHAPAAATSRCLPPQPHTWPASREAGPSFFERRAIPDQTGVIRITLVPTRVEQCSAPERIPVAHP